MYVGGPPSISLGEIGKIKHRRIRRNVPNFKRYSFVKHRGKLAFGEVKPPFKAPPGYQWNYEVDGLSGLGRFRLKKIVKAIKKVTVAPFKAIYNVSKKLIKSKIGRIALIGAGAYFAAPWFLSLASKIGTTAATMLLQKHAPTEEIPQDQATAETQSSVLPSWIAGPAQQYIASQLQPATPPFPGPSATSYPSADSSQYAPSQGPQMAPSTAETPSWVLPAAIGGAALLLLTSL